jgi:hypothetical protein
MNFGESLAYWYFRLNGFLPMSNFVLHRPDTPRRYNADSDLLAVRFPHVFENIGGQPDDWDNDRFAGWGLDPLHQIVCVFAEIKTGQYGEASINRAFRPQRLLYAMRRLGVMPLEQCKDVCRRLSHDGVAHQGDFCFAKVLVASSSRMTGSFDKMMPHRHLELEDALNFIRNRMNRYRDPKEAARMFFPGDLIQFFAWEAGLEVVDVQSEPVEE